MESKRCRSLQSSMKICLEITPVEASGTSAVSWPPQNAGRPTRQYNLTSGKPSSTRIRTPAPVPLMRSPALADAPARHVAAATGEGASECVTDRSTAAGCSGRYKRGLQRWALVCFHVRGDIRHGISGSYESLPIAVPRMDPQNHLQKGLSCACLTGSG